MQEKGIFAWLYAFSSIGRISSENFASWTCALCLRIADFIHLHRAFLTYLKILINSFLLFLHMSFPNSFVRSMKAKPSHRIRKLLHVRTSKMNPALRASSLMHEELFFPRKVLSPHPRACGKERMQYRHSDNVAVLPPCG